MYAGRRRSLRHLGQGSRRAGGAHRAHRRQQGRALRLGQLLADGGHRPLRPLLGNLLRPRPGSVGRPPGSPEEDGDRYIEIWNLVFMQFNRDEQGNMPRLPQALRRHRHGPGAYRRGAAARAQQP
ncbi:hypothetical protein ACU4GD_25500 [Cupriavidus basilensis]